jgi:hypothetical protein
MAGFGVRKDYIVSLHPNVNGRNSDDIDVKEMIAGLYLIVLRKRRGNILAAFSEGNLR